MADKHNKWKYVQHWLSQRSTNENSHRLPLAHKKLKMKRLTVPNVGKEVGRWDSDILQAIILQMVISLLENNRAISIKLNMYTSKSVHFS